MKILVNEKLSQHKMKTPEGYLICTDAILARTGKQEYLKRELFGDACDDSEERVDVDRPYNEVFSNETLASFENKPVTIEHPDEDVNISNYKDYAVGYVRDIRQSKIDGVDVIVGDLVITDQDAINKIESGEMTDLSCGYDCEIKDNEKGEYMQTHIRGNHVALCEEGRAGNARIIDSKLKDGNGITLEMKWTSQKERNANSLNIKYDIIRSEGSRKDIVTLYGDKKKIIEFLRKNYDSWFSEEDYEELKDSKLEDKHITEENLLRKIESAYKLKNGKGTGIFVEVDGKYYGSNDNGKNWYTTSHNTSKASPDGKKQNQDFMSVTNPLSGPSVSIELSRLLTKCPPDMEVDHKDGNHKNNNLSNLEIVTGTENGRRRDLAVEIKKNYNGIVDKDTEKLLISKYGKSIFDVIKNNNDYRNFKFVDSITDVISETELEKYLKSEGISSSYVNPILEHAKKGKEDLDKYLRYEGIIGYTETLWKKINDSKIEDGEHLIPSSFKNLNYNDLKRYYAETYRGVNLYRLDNGLWCINPNIAKYGYDTKEELKKYIDTHFRDSMEDSMENVNKSKYYKAIREIQGEKTVRELQTYFDNNNINEETAYQILLYYRGDPKIALQLLKMFKFKDSKIEDSDEVATAVKLLINYINYDIPEETMTNSEEQKYREEIYHWIETIKTNLKAEYNKVRNDKDKQRFQASMKQNRGYIRKLIDELENKSRKVKNSSFANDLRQKSKSLDGWIKQTFSDSKLTIDKALKAIKTIKSLDARAAHIYKYGDTYSLNDIPSYIYTESLEKLASYCNGKLEKQRDGNYSIRSNDLTALKDVARRLGFSDEVKKW